MVRAGIHLPPLALPVDELTTADHRIGTMGSVSDPGMDKSEAPTGLDVNGLSVVRGRLSHLEMVSLGRH
jgi:hypothetical protein